MPAAAWKNIQKQSKNSTIYISPAVRRAFLAISLLSLLIFLDTISRIMIYIKRQPQLIKNDIVSIYFLIKFKNKLRTNEAENS